MSLKTPKNIIQNGIHYSDFYGLFLNLIIFMTHSRSSPASALFCRHPSNVAQSKELLISKKFIQGNYKECVNFQIIIIVYCCILYLISNCWFFIALSTLSLFICSITALALVRLDFQSMDKEEGPSSSASAFFLLLEIYLL